MKGEATVETREPEVCGGTTSSIDENAPKTITSGEMTYFCVESVIGIPPDRYAEEETLYFVSAFAAPTGRGNFLLLETRNSYERSAGCVSTALVKEDVFPALTSLVRESGLAKINGVHITTHGLPDNFGGSIDIRYASGERISISNNQSPIISYEAGQKIAELFKKLISGEKVSLPDVSALCSIRFEERRNGGAFTKAVLTLNEDGTAINEKSQCFEPPKVYESKKGVSKETVKLIMDTVQRDSLFAWQGLPDNGFHIENDKMLTFVFKNGTELEVQNRRLLPDQIRNGFFDIELEMTVKN